jgi:hypothetical protein
MEAAEGGPRGAALVARERLPVGRVDVLVRGSGRTPRGTEVGTREWRPVERRHVRDGGAGGAPRGAALAVRERLPDRRNDVQFCGGGRHFEVLRWLQNRGWLRDSGEILGEIPLVD